MGLRTFTFGGTSSSTYDMFITQAASYNAPQRSVDMITIPGRNGNFALDNGRFENITVTYHVVVYGKTKANFDTTMSNVRNWLCSKEGYQRLTDDYNSNEYRMAVYKSGLETTKTTWNGAEFDITFDCKPQRWLTSGETAVAVASGGTLTNPTSFESEPLLAVKGYGNIDFNGYDIDIENLLVGEIEISTGFHSNFTQQSTGFAQNFSVSGLNNGDTIYVPSITITDNVSVAGGYTVNSCTLSGQTYLTTTKNTNGTNITIETNATSFTLGTTGYILQGSFTKNLTVTRGGTQTTYTSTFTVNVRILAQNAIRVEIARTLMQGETNPQRSVTVQPLIGDSTKSALGNPTYIDCDIGECWFESGGEIVTLNGVISLGSDLPKLASGTNTFTYDNTITELKVTPRWWKV